MNGSFTSKTLIHTAHCFTSSKIYTYGQINANKQENCKVLSERMKNKNRNEEKKSNFQCKHVNDRE